MIASFAMPWEDRIARQPCCITGCDHKASGLLDLKAQEWCSRQNAGFIYDERLMPGPKPDPFVGVACPHHIEEILARDA